MSDTLDYDKMVLLDAEDLAEAGILEAYESMLPELQEYVPQPVQIEEFTDNDVGRYAVKCGTRQFIIYAPNLDDNGGNDLGGMFLTPSQAEAAQKALPNQTAWPYVPKDEPDWYGQYH
jgi:hypothetical protein